MTLTVQELLPLEWTKIQRRPRSNKQQKRIESNISLYKYNNGDGEDGKNLDVCCDDDFCLNRKDANVQNNTAAKVKLL
jgi:hypothetical protein